MKKIAQLVALLLAALSLLTACNPSVGNTDDTTTADPTVGDTTPGADVPDDPTSTAGGTVVNIDDDALSYFLQKEKFMTNGEYDVTNLEAKAIEYFGDRYTNCGITDILYNIGGSAPFSKEDEDLYDEIDQYYMTEENGVPVDYTTDKGILAAYLIYETTDVDPYQVWFDQCRENGINPWLSIRMNDVHNANETPGRSPFQYKARENGWTIGNSRSAYWWDNTCTQGSRMWYPYALDYTYEEVRERFLKEIDDRLSTYDPYGIELDWHRQIWSFPTDDIENCKYINEFMEDVNEIVEKYEAIYGHDIKIAVRINRDIDENMYFGFDVRYWAQNDWLDVIIPGSYWGSSDSDIPIAEWVEELKGENIEVWPSLECHVMNNSWWHTIPTLAAYSAQYYSQGAQKIYLFNLFNVEKSQFKVCESLETALAAQKRSYIVTESNCTPYNVNGIKQWDPLPIRLSVGTPNTDIVINHGILNYTKDTVIYVAIEGLDKADIDKDALYVQYNGVDCEFDGISKKSYLKENSSFGVVVCYKVPQSAAQDSLKGEITFDAGLNLTITYVELMNGNARINY